VGGGGDGFDLMSKKSKELQRRLSDLAECGAELRKVLVRYERANRTLGKLLAEGIPAIEALERTGAPQLRPELTDALDRFAGARHEARVALLARAAAEGASMADAGRAFSVSRQLASRMIAEAKRDS